MEYEFSNTEAIAALAAHDPQQFRLLVEHYQYSLFGFLGRMGFSREDAEDIAQDVFLKVWRHRASYDPAKARVSTWLFTIARNTALNKLQGNTVQGNKVQLVSAHDVELAADRYREPEQQLQQRQARQRLTNAIQQLPLDDRSVIALFYIDELTSAQAAAILECSPNAFKTRLFRAREKLKAIFNKPGDEQ
jgi:RNA polymerase sigma-70 factor (ECF subfamily)